MDAGSVFAVIAIIFLLWMIRTWLQWDSQARMARQSRERLRNRLADSTLRERVAGSGTAPVGAVADRSRLDSEQPDTADVSEPAIARLHEQLEQAEARAAQAEQNDLELRRLRGELASLQVDKANAAKVITLLERRIREQAAALEKAVECRADNGSQGSQRPATNVRTPLYEAPAQRDDLKLIKGIGPVLERTLNELGVTTFSQLASFTQDDIDKVSAAIGAFSGRIERDDWVGKAQKLVRENNLA